MAATQQFDAGSGQAAMAATQQEFDAGAALLGLYTDLPCVKKLGYSIGEMTGRILLRIIINADCSRDEFFANSMTCIRKGREFRDMMPERMRDEYEVVPMVTSPYEGAVDHFHAITAVIDR